jgi:hypothetical protein
MFACLRMHTAVITGREGNHVCWRVIHCHLRALTCDVKSSTLALQGRQQCHPRNTPKLPPPSLQVPCPCPRAHPHHLHLPGIICSMVHTKQIFLSSLLRCPWCSGTSRHHAATLLRQPCYVVTCRLAILACSAACKYSSPMACSLLNVGENE